MFSNKLTNAVNNYIKTPTNAVNNYIKTPNCGWSL